MSIIPYSRTHGSLNVAGRIWRFEGRQIQLAPGTVLFSLGSTREGSMRDTTFFAHTRTNIYIYIKKCLIHPAL